MGLTELLTNIANAIRNKKGTTELIPAQNFANEINSLPSGDELIAEYEITDSTTTNVVFDNLNISNGELCYITVTGHDEIAGMSVNELKNSSSMYATRVTTNSGGTNSVKNNTNASTYGMVGCLYNNGTIFISKSSGAVTVAGIRDSGSIVIAAGFALTDEVLTKITLYASYSDATEVFKNGTKIQLYKQIKT